MTRTRTLLVGAVVVGLLGAMPAGAAVVCQKGGKVKLRAVACKASETTVVALGGDQTGPQGPQGASGPPGPQGAQGAQGVPGPTGPAAHVQVAPIHGAGVLPGLGTACVIAVCPVGQDIVSCTGVSTDPENVFSSGSLARRVPEDSDQEAEDFCTACFSSFTSVAVQVLTQAICLERQ